MHKSEEPARTTWLIPAPVQEETGAVTISTAMSFSVCCESERSATAEATQRVARPQDPEHSPCKESVDSLASEDFPLHLDAT